MTRGRQLRRAVKLQNYIFEGKMSDKVKQTDCEQPRNAVAGKAGQASLYCKKEPHQSYCFSICFTFSYVQRIKPVEFQQDSQS